MDRGIAAFNDCRSRLEGFRFSFYRRPQGLVFRHLPRRIDGLQTEIVKGEIQEGASVVVGEARANTESGSSNPFAPKLFSGSGNKQQ